MSRRYLRTGIGGEPPEHAKGLTARLELALRIAKKLPPVLGPKQAGWLRIVGEVLHEIECTFPKLKLWCVMKHYHRTAKDIRWGSWLPAVWTAHLSKEQAEKFRTAIAAHYGAEAKKHGWHKDRWRVELHEARISDVIDPECTPEEYVKQLM